MAEQAEQQTTIDKEDTSNILQQCAQNLLNAVQLLNDADRSSPARVISNNRSVPTEPARFVLNNSLNNDASRFVSVANNAPRTTETNRNLSVQEEHRRLFGYRPPAPRSSVQSQPASKKKRAVSGKNGQPILVKDTWTHSFVCLSQTCDDRTPSCKEKAKLSMAGLGEKRIMFDKNGKWPHINQKLLEAFPKLKDGGGYELLRTEDGRKTLILLPCPPGGYTITYLKSVLNQAKAYVRPIQRNLTLNVELEHACYGGVLWTK